MEWKKESWKIWGCCAAAPFRDMTTMGIDRVGEGWERRVELLIDPG